MSTHLATQVGDYLMPCEAYVPKVFTFSRDHKIEREDFGRLCSGRIVQIQWLQFPVFPLDLSFSLLLPLNVSLSPSQYQAGLRYQVGGIAIVFFQMGGMTLINFCFFFFKLTFF